MAHLKKKKKKKKTYRVLSTTTTHSMNRAKGCYNCFTWLYDLTLCYMIESCIPCYSRPLIYWSPINLMYRYQVQYYNSIFVIWLFRSKVWAPWSLSWFIYLTIMPRLNFWFASFQFKMRLLIVFCFSVFSKSVAGDFGIQSENNNHGNASSFFILSTYFGFIENVWKRSSGRAFASDARGPRFDSSKIISNIFCQLWWKDENNEIEAGNGPFKNRAKTELFYERKIIINCSLGICLQKFRFNVAVRSRFQFSV